MATLTPEIAQDLIWRSMVTGVPTTEFEKYGGYEAVDAMYKAGGGEYSHDAIPVDLRNQLGQQVAQTGAGNLSILEKTGNALSAGAIENMAKAGTISSLPLFMERGIPIAESAMPTAQRYISMLPALTGTLQPTAKPTQPTQQPSLLPPAFSGSGLSIPSAYPSQTQTLDFLSPTGTITPSPQLPVSTLPGYTFSPITTPTVSSIVPSAVPQPQAPVDTQLPSIQQSVQDQFQQRVFGVPRSDIEQFIASRSPQPRVPEYSPMLTPTVSRQQLEQLNRLYGIPQTPPQDDNMQFFREGGAVKKFADGGPSSGVRRLEMSGYQAGGEVTDDMFVGTAPSEESQQTTGEYIKGLYKENIPVHARVYLETLLGKKDPVTAEDFTKEELADIEKLLSSKPAKGTVTEYSDYEKVRDLDREGRHSSDWLENLPSVGKTLGRFTYETLPDGRRVIKDTYDFYNTSRSINVQEFEEMGPAEKALAVFKRITADRSVMDPPFVKRAADVLGEAYIGRDGRPVKVEYDPKDLPVKRQDGSPSQGEISDDMFVGTRPEDFPETSPVDKKAGELLRALSEGTRGFVGAEPIEPGSEAYRTGQALANMPAVGVVAGTVKGAGKAKDALKSMLPSAKLVDTPEFQNWFGRSKTVNEGGKPLVLYHATPKDITEFIPGGQNPELSGPAIWMTPNKDFQPAAHNLYTGKGSFVSGANVIPLFASVKNPLITSLRTWKDDLKPFGGSPWTLDKEAVSKMKKAGHDGIMYYDEKGNLEEVAVFKPTQVKSAISNEGTFSPRKKAITKAKGGEVTNDEFIQEMMVGTRPTDLPVKREEEGVSNDNSTQEMFTGTRPSDFPETSPVDTAVSDFVSSRSKLVTDPQEFFRVMGQNIEEYHSKPLREDPQKYLTEQLGPGALAGTVGKTAKQLFSSLPSSEAPFVGRLDEFVSSLPGAVQKDQFLNQLKGKFRDYDIGRAQEALADLPGNAKLTPFDLLNRVKRVYDPTTFTTKIDLPKAEDDYHAGTDNPFQTKKGFSQKPLGVIHLLQGVNPTTSPDAAKLMAAYDDITNRLPGTTSYSFDKTDRNPVSLAQDIYKIANRAGLSSVEDLGMDVQTVLQNMSQSGSDWSKLISAKTILGNPGRYPLEIKEALDETARITGTLPEENIRSLKKIAEEINVRRTTNQDYSDLESQYHSSFPYAFVEDLEKANRRLWNEHRKGKQQIEGLLEGLQKREGIKARVYRGQHSSLAEDSSTIRDPIAFSRFTEHTTDIPGLGKVDGIYVNELQSDRLDDIRTKGRMGGGPQEDITRLDKLDKQVGEAAKQLADYKSAMGFRFMNESDIATVSEFNSKLEGLSNKRNTLLGRIREGEYSLKESFAGMEESPQVIQQLMAKNAVAGAMQLGKRFVAFPGAESAQAQLYEKLPNNLKQVVKDLGPGFELRPITLPKPDTSAGGEGGELTSYAIVWGDEAADRIKKQGVPFKDGGEVSTEDFIKRFSKGGATEDESWKDEMFVGTRPSDEATSPGILPPEIRQAVDVPLDFANLLIRGTAAVPIGGVAGLYKGITGGKYGTQEGVKEADTEAARMMAKITGEPKTQTAKDVLQFVGDKAQEYKLDAALPQLLTLPSPGPGAASALMRSYELAETPPLGTVKLAGDKGVKPATPPTDQMGFYSPAEKAVMGLPQDKGTASQMLAQITKTQGVKPVELRATGLEDYLKGKGNEPVTKQEIQDFLTNNRVQVDEVVLGRGLSMSPEAKRLMEDAEKRMMKADQVMAPFFEQQEAGSLLQGQEPYSTFYRIRGPLSRKIAKGDQEALAELDALNLPPDIRQAVLDFGSAKLDYQKHSKPARFEQKPKFDGYNTSGGTNAREIYLTLPGEQMPSSSPPSVNAQGVLVKPMYATQPKFTAPSPHSVSPEADANRLAHIFLDERKDAKGNNVLFVQEMQSDWAQQGRDKGFAIVDKLPEGYSVKQDLIVSGQPWGVVDKNGQFVTAGFHRSKEDAVAEVIQRLNTYKLPTAPFVTNTEDWVNLALKRVIKEAVDNDIDTVAFIKGGQAADKYSLRTFVDYISADRKTTSGVEHLPGATDDLYVFIAPKDSLSPHAFYVGPDGIIKEPISADVRSKFLGEPLSKVIGKEAAEKLLSTKIGESQVLRDEGLTLGGKGMEGFYDNILPKTAEKLLKKLGGGKVEPVEVVKGAPSQMPYEANAFLDWMEQNHPGTKRSEAARAWGMGMENNQFVKDFYEATKADQYLGFKITPEMKEMVKTEGLPKFAAGGEVTDFIKRAA
jgi:hypothetical protein